MTMVMLNLIQKSLNLITNKSKIQSAQKLHSLQYMAVISDMFD
jgi:hypothetical protein